MIHQESHLICYCLSNAPQLSCKDLWGLNPIQICNHSSPGPLYVNYLNSRGVSRVSDCDNDSQPVGLLNITLKFFPTHLLCNGRCHIWSSVRFRSGKQHNYLVTYPSTTNIPLFFGVCFTDDPVSLDCLFKLQMQSWRLKFNRLFVSLQIMLGVQQLFFLTTIYMALYCYRGDQSKE